MSTAPAPTSSLPSSPIAVHRPSYDTSTPSPSHSYDPSPHDQQSHNLEAHVSGSWEAEQRHDAEQFSVFADECDAIFRRTLERSGRLSTRNSALSEACEDLRRRLKQTTEQLKHLESSIAASLDLGDPAPLLGALPTSAHETSIAGDVAASSPTLTATTGVGNGRRGTDESGIDGTVEGPVIACLIDGDGAIPHPSFLKQGRHGGARFHEVLSSYISQAAKTVSGRTGFKIVVQVYHHRAHLSQTFVQHHVCDPRTFAEFVSGFNTADSLSSMVDMGSGAREATRRKLAGLLDLYTSLPKAHSPLVFFAGAYDPLYSAVLMEYIDGFPVAPTGEEDVTAAALERVVILKGFVDVAPEIKAIRGLRIVGFPRVFLSQRPGDGTAPLPTTPPKRHAPLPSSAQSTGHGRPVSVSSATSVRPHIAPFSIGGVGHVRAAPEASPRTGETTAGGEMVGAGAGGSGGAGSMDPKKVRAEVARNYQTLPQNPAPCNWHYILGECPRGKSCDFGHNYRISPEQLQIIKRVAQQNPCFNLLEYGQCGDSKCFYGHKCPYGRSCDKRGTGCKFVGGGMHE